MNTRLQVEHPVTEAVYGIDLVEEQLRIASGLAPTFDPDALAAARARDRAADQRRGPEAVPARPGRDRRPGSSRPATGSGWTPATRPAPPSRPFYDSLMAKLIVHGADRAEAIERARAAVAGFEIAGPKCNLPFFAELLENAEFLSGDYDTGIVGADAGRAR